jgi:hypothetical protein
VLSDEIDAMGLVEGTKRIAAALRQVVDAAPRRP